MKFKDFIQLNEIQLDPSNLQVIQHTPEYEAILRRGFKLVSTPQQLKNGTLEFRRGEDGNHFNIKTRGRASFYSHKGGMEQKIIKDSGSHIDEKGYIERLKSMADYIDKRDIRKEETNKINFSNFEGSDLSELSLPDEMKALNLIGGNYQSLKGAPKIITGTFRLRWNNSTEFTFEGGPEKVGILECRMNDQCKIKGTEFLPLKATEIDLRDSFFETLIGIGKNRKCLRITVPTFYSGGLGLLTIPNLKELKIIGQLKSQKMPEHEHAFWIIWKHFTDQKDVLECKADLIENGLSAFAKL
ncbi:MAG: hypothetical protein QXN55_01120 [Candidatus Nitrosotenuis sp.]